jgi:hypothetical protein
MVEAVQGSTGKICKVTQGEGSQKHKEDMQMWTKFEP